MPMPAPASTPLPESESATAVGSQLPIIGAVEYVRLDPGNVLLEARIDTGAETTSIHAEQIRLVEKDGKRFVRFTILDPATGEALPMELRLRRRALIKRHDGEPERRFVVRMWLTLGESRERVEVTLTDRQQFEYPLLVGRNFLIDSAIVDVSLRHTQSR